MKFLLVVLFILFSSGTVASTQTEHGFSPCGELKNELTRLTQYWKYRWAAEHQDMTPDEVAHFLEMNNLGNSEITGVRVFRSRFQPTYALVAYRLFENFLNGKPLVQLNCVVRLNGTFGLHLDPLELQDMMGTIYEDIGKSHE